MQTNKGSSGRKFLNKHTNNGGRSSISESDRSSMIYGMGRQEMNRSLFSYHPAFYHPMSMAAAGYYRAATSNIASTLTSAGASSTNASFQYTYPYSLLPYPIIGLLPGMARPREMSFVTGPGVMRAGLCRLPPDFNVASFFKSEKKDPSDCHVSTAGRQQQGAASSVYPSTSVPFTSSPSFTTVSSTSGGDSTSFLTNTTTTSSTATTSIVAETDSRCPPTAQEAEGSKDATAESQESSIDKVSSSTETDSGHPLTTQEAEGSKEAMAEGQESSILNVSSSSSSTNKRHQSRSTKQVDEAYREKRRRNNESAKRSRDAKREKEKYIEERIMILEQANYYMSINLSYLKMAVEDQEQTLKSCSEQETSCE